MAGIASPTVDAQAKAIAALLKTVTEVPPEVAHDRFRLLITKDGLVINGYDPGKSKVHYWETTMASAIEEEHPATRFFIDRREFSIRGVYGFEDGLDDDNNSTAEWRTIIEAIRNKLRADTTVFGTPHNTPRSTRLAVNGLQKLPGIGVAHFAEIRVTLEGITDDC